MEILSDVRFFCECAMYKSLRDTFNAFDKDGSTQLGYPEYVEAWKFFDQSADLHLHQGHQLGGIPERSGRNHAAHRKDHPRQRRGDRIPRYNPRHSFPAENRFNGTKTRRKASRLRISKLAHVKRLVLISGVRLSAPGCDSLLRDFFRRLHLTEWLRVEPRRNGA